MAFENESQQVIPGEILWDGVSNDLPDFALARFAIALRHFLATAPGVIERVKSGPGIRLIEFLRIGAADSEVNVINIPIAGVVKGKNVAGIIARFERPEASGYKDGESSRPIRVNPVETLKRLRIEFACRFQREVFSQ